MNKIVKNLLLFVTRNPECVLVFNDVEEVDNHLDKILALILNTGEYDGINFRKTIMFFTTSLGQKIYTSSLSGNLSNVTSSSILNSLIHEKNSQAWIGNISKPLAMGLSRGKLLMMNYLEPLVLKKVIEDKLERKFAQFTNNTNINVNYDLNELSTTLLYINNKEYNAQSVSSLVQYFVEKELNDIYNQLDPITKKPIITELKDINISLDFKNSPSNVLSLYTSNVLKAMVICDKEHQEIIKKNIKKFKNIDFVFIDSLNELKDYSKNDIDFVLLDVLLNIRKMKYLPTNLEDYNTEGVDAFNYISTYWNDLPLFILSMNEYNLSYENYISFLIGNCKDILSFNQKNIKSFVNSISEIHQAISLERNIKELIANSKVLTYNSTQILDKQTSSLNVKLSHLALSFGQHQLLNGKLLSKQSNFKFNDVVGNETAKNVLSVYIEYLKNPKKFLENGSKVPKGLLLYGEAETGKTRLVQALAGEACVTLFHHQAGEILISCGDSTDLKNKVHEIFTIAKDNAPSILLIDDLDALIYDTENIVENSIVKFFMSELDFLTSDDEHPVLFVGTTSESKEEFPSKFIKKLDRCIGITLPNEKEREEYINKYLKQNEITTISNSVIHNIALRTFGEPIAYIKNIIDFVIKNAYGKTITDKMILDAIDLYDNGDESKHSDEINLSTAYHEMGHALVEILLGEHPSFVTIVSRGNFYGYTKTDSHEEDGSFTVADLRNQICCAHGGRVAEKLFFGDKGINTGYSNDIKMATYFAKQIVCSYGMGSTYAYMGYLSNLQLPERYINEIEQIIKEEFDHCYELLNANKDLLEYLAKILFERNSLTGEEIEKEIEIYKNNHNNI